MKTKLVDLTPKDFQEIVALFSSPARDELAMVYDPQHSIYFEKVDLEAEKELTEERKEYALDAARAVLYWLHRHGYRLTKDDQVDDLSWVEDDLFV